MAISFYKTRLFGFGFTFGVHMIGDLEYKTAGRLLSVRILINNGLKMASVLFYKLYSYIIFNTILSSDLKTVLYQNIIYCMYKVNLDIAMVTLSLL